MFIYLTEIQEKLIVEEAEKQNLRDKVNSFLTVEATKNDSYYSIRFWNGYIAICNDKYVDY